MRLLRSPRIRDARALLASRPMADPAMPGAVTTTRLPGWQDAGAALSLAGLLLPEAVAYSAIAGLPPQAGVIALLAGLFCYGLLGTSRYAVVSATSSSAAVLAASVATLSNGDAALRFALAGGLVLLTGALFIVAAAARLGAVSAFIAKPVLRGFAFGLALVIIVRQLPKMVDVHPASANIVPFTAQLLAAAAQWNRAGLALGLGALVLLLWLARWPRVPAALVVIALAIVAEPVAHWSRFGIATVGEFQLALTTPVLPDLSQAQWLRLGELAFALMLVLYAESYGSIRTYAIKHGDAVQPNRDLLALGVANAASGLLQGMPVGAGYSATSANEAAGAQSRWAGLIAGAVILVAVLTLVGIIARTPEPVLAAVVIHAVSHSLSLHNLRPYFLWQRDRIVMLAAIAAVLLLGVLDGLLVAIAASLLFALRELAEAKVCELGRFADGHTFLALDAHPDARPEPQMIILRPEAPLFFANVERLLGDVRRQVAARGADLRAVVLSLEESPDLDSSAIEGLRDLAADLQREGKLLRITRLKDPAYAVLQRAALPGLQGDALSVLSVDAAVAAARHALDGLPPAAARRSAEFSAV